MRQFTLKELASLTGAELSGDPSHLVTGVNTLSEATPSDVSFLTNSIIANPKYYGEMVKSKAGLVCIAKGTELVAGKNFLIAENADQLFQKVVFLFLGDRIKKAKPFGIHPTAVIHPTAKIEEQVVIGPYVVIEEEAFIGSGTILDAHVYIGSGAKIGSNCHLQPFSVVREWCCLGHRVILQPGAVIGSCGFGYAPDAQGNYQKLEQLGIVILEDDVEIGANSTIDRARFQTTLIRRGTKIDNLVQIAHNVEIGECNLIAAQTGIAGSAKTGKRVMLGGQVGVLGHIELADNVLIATRGGVSKSLKSGTYRGSPAIPIQEYNRQEVYIRKLEELVDRLKILEKKVSLS